MNKRIFVTLGLTGGVLLVALVAPVLRARADAPVQKPVFVPPPPLHEPVGEPIVEPEPEPISEPVAEVDPEPEPVIEVPLPEKEAKPRNVDIVIALDTSGSMSGLIDSTRARLWDIVNQAVAAEESPHVRVGLVTFGTPTGSSAEQGWVNVRMDLTDDLDTFYENLMGLHTNGGDEYVGWAIDTSTRQMTWSDDDDAVRMLFVAGNESADQARQTKDFRIFAGNAKESGITVHSLFAGDIDAGRSLHWADVARFGGGDYAAIDMNRATVAVVTPYDQQLSQLNTSLNGTYIAFGAHGSSGLARQQAQDANASSYGSIGSRVATKSSGSYNNARWDLVDARKRQKVSIEEMEEEDLPAEMQGMAPRERRAYVDGKEAERTRITNEIAMVNMQRSQWLAAERARDSGQAGLDDAMRGMVRGTMEAKGFNF